MSAWIASDKHIASVVCNAHKHASNEFKQKLADMLKKANIRSVNYRYNERTRITPCDLNEVEVLDWKDVAMLAASLDYQSCERPDWKNSKARLALLEIRADAAHKLSEGGKWSL